MQHDHQVVDIDDLVPYPSNARRGNLDLVRASLVEHGQYRDLIIQRSTNYILCGNNTWLAAQAEGWKQIDVDYIDVDDASARKINLIDNKANDEATYDNEALARILQDLEGDFTGTGYVAPDLDRLLDSLSTTTEKADIVPPVPVDANTSPGDIWILGDHKLYCGDCTDPETLAMVMEGDLANLVITSPPYNTLGFKTDGAYKGQDKWSDRMADAYDDQMPEPEYQEQQIKLIDSLMEHTENDASFFYNHKIRYRDKEIVTPYLWLALTKWKIRQEIIWDRGTTVVLNSRMFAPYDERIYWLFKDDFVFFDTSEVKSYSTIWDIAPKVDVKMSAPFPTEIPKRCIQACSERGDIVLDPYGGTGTTLIAAEMLGRRARIIEMNPAYCDCIVARYEAFTGEKAKMEDA